MAGGYPLRRGQIECRRAGEVLLVLSAGRDAAHNNLSATVRPHQDYQPQAFFSLIFPVFFQLSFLFIFSFFLLLAFLFFLFLKSSSHSGRSKVTRVMVGRDTDVKITSHGRTTVGCNSQERPCAKIQQKQLEDVSSENSRIFVIWKMIFMSEVCSCSSIPTEGMVWINEIDAARNMDLPVLSTSYWLQTSRGKSTWTSKKAQQDNRFLKGRQITCMIYDYFKISGNMRSSCNALLRVQLKNDNVQGFDPTCEEVLLSMTEVPDGDTLDFFKQETASLLRGIETSHGIYTCRIRENEPVVLDGNKGFADMWSTT